MRQINCIYSQIICGVIYLIYVHYWQGYQSSLWLQSFRIKNKKIKNKNWIWKKLSLRLYRIVSQNENRNFCRWSKRETALGSSSCEPQGDHTFKVGSGTFLNKVLISTKEVLFLVLAFSKDQEIALSGKHASLNWRHPTSRPGLVTSSNDDGFSETM